MSEHDTTDSALDAELRTRFGAFERAIADRTDTEAALAALAGRPPRSTPRLLALAACLLAVVALAVAVRREVVRSTDPAAPSEECLETTGEPLPETTTPGGSMNTTIAVGVAAVTTTIALLGACDDGPTTLVEGDVELVGSNGLGGQHIVLSAEEDDGVVTGQIRFNDSGNDDPAQVVETTLRCARTDVDGFVVVGGENTGPEGSEVIGDRVAIAIREGEPARLALYVEETGSDSCEEFLDQLTEDQLTNPDPGNAAEVESGELDLG